MELQFGRYYKAIAESLGEDSFAVLGYRIFEGSMHNIKVSMAKVVNDESQARIMIKSLNDPKIAGYVQYNSKRDAIMAFNNLDNLSKVLEYIDRHKEEPSAYSLVYIHNDESTDDEAPAETTPSSEMGIPGSEMGGGMPPSTPSFGGEPSMTGGEPLPEIPEAPGGEPAPGGETPPMTPEPGAGAEPELPVF